MNRSIERVHYRLSCRHCLSNRETNERTIMPLEMTLSSSVTDGKAVLLGYPCFAGEWVKSVNFRLVFEPNAASEVGWA
jgi:hypothetical protein